MDRDLRVVHTEEELSEFDSIIAGLRRQLDERNRMKAMFRSAGWKSVEQELLSELNHATRALVGDTLREMPAVAFVRGQMRALEFLLSYPERIEQEQELLKAQIQDLEADRDGTDLMETEE